MINEQKILNRIGALVSAKAKEMCPFDKGDLINSIGYRIEGDTVIIFADASYASDLEYGTPPEPNMSEDTKEGLRDWANRKGVSPNKIVNYIKTKGIQVGTVENPLHITSYNRDSYRPYMRPALFQSVEDIKQIIKEEI